MEHNFSNHKKSNKHLKTKRLFYYILQIWYNNINNIYNSYDDKIVNIRNSNIIHAFIYAIA